MSQIVNKQESPVALHSSIPQGLVVSPDSRLRHAQAETMARYQMAFMLQRDWLSVGPKLLALCDDPEFAAEAYYRRPGEGGSRDSEGLTIRFAEAALRIMRNVSVDTTPEMEDDHAVHVRLTVLDLESNTPTSETFRVDKTMVKFSVQDDDVIVAERTNAAGKKMWVVQASEEQISARVRGKSARVKRALILSLIPAEVRAQCLAKVRSVVVTSDAKDPAAAVKGLVGAFIGMGIDVPDLKEYLGKSPAQATPLQIEELRSILVMLREGDVSWAQALADKRAAMEAKGTKAAFVAAKEKEKEKQKASKPPTQRRPRAAAAAASTDGAAAPAAATGNAADTKPEPPPAKPRASRRGDDAEDESAAGSSDPASNSATA